MDLLPGTLVTALYDAFPDPVLVTDADGMIVASNPAAAQVLGYEAAELAGIDVLTLLVPDHVAIEPDGEASSDEPSRLRQRRRTGVRAKDGRVLEVDFSRTALAAGGETSSGAVVVLRVLEADPRSTAGDPDTNALFMSALDSVSHGFAIYDPDDRLLVCNKAYRDMHPLLRPSIRIGKTYEATLRDALEAGLISEAGDTPESRDEWLRKLVDLHNNPGEPYVRQIGDDRWIQIEDRITEGNFRVGLRADVSALVRARSEAERLGVILEGVSQEIYLVNPVTRAIIYVNKAARDNLQYSLEEMRGMDARLLNAGWSPEQLSEKMRPLVSGEVKTLTLDTRHRRKDGSTYHCRIKFERLRTENEPLMLSFGEDITERLEIENALQRKRAEFETLVRSLPDFITRSEPDTTLTYVNENYARFSGMRAEDMIGLKFIDLIPPELQPEVQRKLESLQPDQPMKTEERLMRDHAGRTYWYAWTNLMVFENGRPLELVSLGRDITESHLSRERIAQQARELAMRNQALEQFAGMVSHDLKAPLRQIRLFVDMIAEDVSNGRTEDLKKFSEHISGRAESMERMVSSLLEYSQLAYQAIKPSSFMLSEAVSVAWSNLSVNAAEANARLINDSDIELNADFDLMIQLLQNLFANSIKYRLPDQPVLVEVEVELVKNRIHISVADNGIGIAPEHAESIFGVFKRLHRDQRTYSGNGLGLSLCRLIAESHDGTVVLDTSYGPPGARFVLSLPRRLAQAGTGAAEPSVSPV
ncbi:PAS domain S-box protein [Hoeflea olei]|uniref:histidine kinase n=1 Tax=Hoeflea olei TaxID=1480615 RepID=A0A1C1YZ68_9HYPH|nr:PAS domain S-box protein [Hoeflea olei]OCW58833.1 hypothetical protein AWJ14_20825 [Hoeflea olei]